MTVAVVAFVILFALMLTSTPISVSAVLATIGGIFTSGNLNISVLAQKIFESTNSFTLIAVPLFMLAGRFMALGGITRDLLNFSSVLVGFLRGGLAYVNVVASMFFAGITGSAAADTASIGAILIPTMIHRGYEKDFSVAVTATSSTIGVMIPPSIGMILYGVAANVSIGDLFMGGAIPGVLVGLALMAVCAHYARKRNYPREERLPVKEALKVLLKGVPAMMTVVIIIGGIMAGLFTATEAAVVAVIYTFLLDVFYYKELKISHIPGILLEVSLTVGMVVLMVGGTSALGWLFARLGVPGKLTAAMLSISDNRYVIMGLILLLLLFIGTWLDNAAAITLFTPILYPIAMSIGMDPVHFGVVMIVGLAIGMFTPPVGVCLFIACGIAKVTITETLRAFVPFFLAMVAILVLITYVPQIVLWLPSLMA